MSFFVFLLNWMKKKNYFEKWMCQAKCVKAIINKSCLYNSVYQGFVMNVTSKCMFLLNCFIPQMLFLTNSYCTQKWIYFIYPYTVVEMCAVSKQMEATCFVYWLTVAEMRYPNTFCSQVRDLGPLDFDTNFVFSQHAATSENTAS